MSDILARIGPASATRRRRAVELADSLVDRLAEDIDAGMGATCPLCELDNGEHSEDWGDGSGGCPVLEYQRARLAELGKAVR